MGKTILYIVIDRINRSGSHIISDGVAQGYISSKAVFGTAYQILEINKYERFN